MTERTCATCRWWEATYLDDDTDTRVCALTADNPRLPASKATVIVEYGYPAALKTAPDFGCNQWEPKENAE